MNKPLLAFIVVCLVGLGAPVISAQPQAGQLTYTLAALSPEVPYPGQEVVAGLTYTATVPGAPISGGGVVSYTVAYSIAVEGVGGTALCPGACRFTLDPSGTSQLKFYAPAKVGTYALTISLQEPGAEPPRLLAERSLVVDTALPPSVAQLFAGLGLFAAVMAIMALGTEVVIELGKSFLGLKAKVTALEALNQFKSELPGQLNQLGVDEATIKTKLGTVMEGLSSRLQLAQDAQLAITQLKPELFGEVVAALPGIGALMGQVKGQARQLASQVDQAERDIQRGLEWLAKNYPEAAAQEKIRAARAALHNDIESLTPDRVAQVIQAFVDSLPGSTDEHEQLRASLAALSAIGASGSRLKELEEQLRQGRRQAELGIKSSLDLLAKNLPIDPKLIASTQTTLLNMVASLDPAKMTAETEKFVLAVQAMVKSSEAAWTQQWLLAKAPDLVNYSKPFVLNRAEKEIYTTLRGLGFGAADINSVQTQLSALVDTAASFVQENANRYAAACRELLKAVEGQRNDYQSPARKLWRRLRHSSLPMWVVVVVGVPLAFAAIWQVRPPSWWPVTVLPPLADPASLLLYQWAQVGVLVMAVSIVVYAFVDALLNPSGHAPASSRTLGYFLRYVVERGWNRLLGRSSTKPDAQQYGEPDITVVQAINAVTPVTLAKTLLERDEKHQDEEISRVRAIRVVSLVVGVYLAYTLKVDAADYLNYAVPGIAERINAVRFNPFGLLPDLTVGILLTGLAASAGSKFWRDLLGRLQAARGEAEEAARAVRAVKDLLPNATGKGGA